MVSVMDACLFAQIVFWVVQAVSHVQVYVLDAAAPALDITMSMAITKSNFG